MVATISISGRVMPGGVVLAAAGEGQNGVIARAQVTRKPGAEKGLFFMKLSYPKKGNAMLLIAGAVSKRPAYLH